MTGQGHIYSTDSAWSIEVDERIRELRKERVNLLDKWLAERGFDRVAYKVPHKGQTVLSAGGPKKKYPYHWCLCTSEKWECKECVCKNWKIVELLQCVEEPMWVLEKMKRYNC